MASLSQEEMQNIAESATKIALNKGADEAEVLVYQDFTTTVGIERGQITKSARIADKGTGIRTAVKKAVGFSYTNVLEDKTAVEEAVHRAISSAKASKPDGNWHGLPDRKPFPALKNTYDRRIVELQSEDLVALASSMLGAAEETDKRVFAIEGGAGASHLSVAIANSNGISGFDEGTVVHCSLATVAQERSEVTPVCFEFNAERSYDVDPEWIGREAARLAVSALRPRKAETKNAHVIFAQTALQELFNYTLINAVKADYVQRGQSAFKGRIGEEVGSKAVTIYDDGIRDGGLRTWKFDGEGFPPQKTTVIEHGVLRGFIYDNYSAKIEGKESTGNAFRAGYLSTPGVEATNFRVVPGSSSPEELVGEVDDGFIVLFLQGAHSSNPASGEFSVVAAPAWKIRKGEIVHATKAVMLAGNIFQLLRNVSVLANDERQVGPLVAPWVLVENVKVIGK